MQGIPGQAWNDDTVRVGERHEPQKNAGTNRVPAKPIV